MTAKLFHCSEKLFRSFCRRQLREAIVVENTILIAAGS